MPTWSSLSQQFRQGLFQVAHAGADFLVPRVCPGCRRQLSENSSHPPSATVAFCQTCLQGLGPPHPNLCGRCSAPVGPHLDTSQGCLYCQAERFAFQQVFSLGTYEGPFHKICGMLKQPGAEPMAFATARLLYDRWQSTWSELPLDLVIPVPHHWTERLGRPQLPPVSLSRFLSKSLRIPYSIRLLKKRIRTPPQKELSATERRSNLRHAFAAAPNKQLQARTVLLVDDILTTGSTAHFAAKALLKAGVKQVYVAVIARAIGRRN